MAASPLSQALTSATYCSVDLTQTDQRQKIWHTYKSASTQVIEVYRANQFNRYAARMEGCGQRLGFYVAEQEQLRLATAWFCRVRWCPLCQWRRSLQWKARAYQALPLVTTDFPQHRWLFLTLTVQNCPPSALRTTLQTMHLAFQRLTKLKAWPGKGWIKATEVTEGQDGLAHPHFHCLLMVAPSYFDEPRYLPQKQWQELWKASLRIDYAPIVDVRAIPATHSPTTLVPEVLKYQTKIQDLTQNPNWLLTLTQQLHQTRAIGVGGTLRHYFQANANSSNLDVLEQENSSEATLNFSWDGRRYNLDV